jgi:hypothetical protein
MRASQMFLLANLVLLALSSGIFIYLNMLIFDPVFFYLTCNFWNTDATVVLSEELPCSIADPQCHCTIFKMNQPCDTQDCNNQCYASFHRPVGQCVAEGCKCTSCYFIPPKQRMNKLLANWWYAGRFVHVLSSSSNTILRRSIIKHETNLPFGAMWNETELLMFTVCNSLTRYCYMPMNYWLLTAQCLPNHPKLIIVY